MGESLLINDGFSGCDFTCMVASGGASVAKDKVNGLVAKESRGEAGVGDLGPLNC